MKNLFLYLLILPFFLKAQKITFGLKGGFILSLNQKLKRGFQLGGVADFRFRRLIVKNELIYNQFFRTLKDRFEGSSSYHAHRIYYGFLPGIKIKRWFAFHAGPIFSALFNYRTKNLYQNKFNIGVTTGINFYLKKLTIELGTEFSNFLAKSPCLIKLSLGYNFKKRK